MASRPRRSAAQRATMAITDMADRDRDPAEQRTMSSRSSRRSGGNGLASVTRGPPSSSPVSSAGDGNQHIHLTVKLPSSKLRQATSSATNDKRKSSGGVATAGGSKTGASKRTRGGKKSYVIESSEDEDEEDEEEDEEEEEEEEEEEDEEEEEPEEDEIEVGTRAGFAKVEDDEEERDEDEQMDLGEDDAEGDDDGDEMDVDAEGEDDGDDEDADADADGDVDMDATPAPRAPTIKITKPPKSTSPLTRKGKGGPSAKPVAKGTAVAKTQARDDDEEEDDDEELSELESELEDVTVEVADADGDGDEDEDVDAEGEEIEVADEDAEGEEEELLSDEDGLSRGETPDLSKLTVRQRAKLGDVSHEYMKLSDEVQAKKHFTAEELSMRRAEMARRRRNLSDKRNEEVKMETINKLLKKQAPKTTRKNAALMAAGDETPDSDTQRADPMFIRWVSNKAGNRVAVPDELLDGPAGRVFVGGGASGGRAKMVQEVS